MKIENLMENAKVGHILDVSIKQNGSAIYAYYEVKDIRSENDEQLIEITLSEDVKHLRDIKELDLEKNSTITINQWDWFDIVNGITTVKALLLEDFIDNEDVNGATKYALTLKDKEQAVDFLKTFGEGLVDLIEVARSHQSW